MSPLWHSAIVPLMCATRPTLTSFHLIVHKAGRNSFQNINTILLLFCLKLYSVFLLLQQSPKSLQWAQRLCMVCFLPTFSVIMQFYLYFLGFSCGTFSFSSSFPYMTQSFILQGVERDQEAVL